MNARISALTFIHGVLVAIMLAIAVQLYLPGDTFATGSSWNVVARNLTEQQTASICWMSGCFGGVGLFPVPAWLRLSAVAVLFLAHTSMAIAFFLAAPAGISFLLLAGYAAFGTFLIYRGAAG